MQRSFQLLSIGALLLIGSGGEVLAHCGRSHSVVAPHYGYSYGQGGPNINRYSHHFRPRQFDYGQRYYQPHRRSYGGYYNKHRRDNNHHRYYRPRRGGPYNFRYNH